MAIIAIATLVGAIVTVTTKRDPGTVLGGFVILGTLVAGFAVRQRSSYLLIPVPALCYLIFALATGLVRHHDMTSSSGLTVDAAQWIANGFMTMAAATGVAVVIWAARWFWAWRTNRAGVSVRSAATSPAARPEPEARSRPGGEPGADRSGQLRGGPPPERSFGPEPAWPHDPRDGQGPLDQGARWAQGDGGGDRGYRDGPGYRDERGYGGPGPGPGGQGDDFWERRAEDRRWSRGREPGDQGQGDWRRRPPRPPSYGSSRDLAGRHRAGLRPEA
jgi:hypothetical protein